MSKVIGELIYELTKGRPFAFMIMPYGSRYANFRSVQAIVDETLKIPCLRADDLKASGHDLLAKIHFMIQRSEFVIADITPTRKEGTNHFENSPNVFYEIGYAKAIGKHILILVEEDGKVPTDLVGLEVIRYCEDGDSFQKFESDLKKHLSTRLATPTSALRDMLLAETPRPSFVVASPKYPDPLSKKPGPLREMRTYGDNLGVLGLISAFGAMLGEKSELRLLSAKYHVQGIAQMQANLYLIGSGKVNDLSDPMLERMQQGAPHQFRFGPYPGEESLEDYRVGLYEGKSDAEGMSWELLGNFDERMVMVDERLVHTKDHGLIIRGPHPDYPDRFVMVMAGPHSLGTGAACLAVTDSRLINRIQSMLPEDLTLLDRHRTIFVHVTGEVGPPDYHLDPEGVKIVRVGELHPRRVAEA